MQRLLWFGLNAVHGLARHVAAPPTGGTGSGDQGGLGAELGKHDYVCLFGQKPCAPTSAVGIGSQLNLDTVLMTILVMAIILLLALVVRGRLSVTRPGWAQNMLEAIFEFVNGLVGENLGPERLASIGPLAVALFLFILLSNYIGLIPVGIEGWHSPTSDLNTTLSLALMVFVLVQVLGIRARGGGGYVKHFFQPPYLSPINFIEELSKPVTLSFRLFGNIFAGEVLILVFASLLGGFLPGLVFGHAFALALGLFVGAIQAFIFTLLTVVYIGIGTSAEGHHAEGGAHPE